MKEESKGIQVIVAGLGRTGTMSMEVALGMLGYQPYHMGAILVEPGHSELWRNRAQGTATSEEVLQTMADCGYNATMDSPMCDIYLDQLQLYPNAKVILTTHPKGAAGWADSFLVLMRMVQVQSRPFSWWYPNFWGWIPRVRDLNRMRDMIGTTTLQLKPGELCYGLWEKENPKLWLQGLYEIHNNHVRKHVPQGQLLEFDVTQGWGPLCAFLEKPEPREDFPHVNDSQAMKRTRVVIQVLVYTWIPLVTCGLLGGVHLATTLWHRHNSRSK